MKKNNTYSIIQMLFLVAFLLRPLYVSAATSDKQINLIVTGCNENAICENAIGENALNCPHDCSASQIRSGGGGGGLIHALDTTNKNTQIKQTDTSEDIRVVEPVKNVSVKIKNTGIMVSWVNPNDDTIDYIRVTRNTDRYHRDPFIGYAVYSGQGNFFVDTNIISNQRYFYTVFVHTKDGLFSAGVGTTIRSEKEIIQAETTSLEKVPLLPDFRKDIAAQVVVSQSGIVVPFDNRHIAKITNPTPIEIAAALYGYSSQDDVWVDIKKPDGELVGAYLFSYQEKEGIYKVTIPALYQNGNYTMVIAGSVLGEEVSLAQGSFDIEHGPSIQGVGEKTSQTQTKDIILFIFFLLMLSILLRILPKL
jgi:hypothetical protein